MSVGSVGLPFGLNFDAKGSVQQPFQQLGDFARCAGSTELWVYIGSDDEVARMFYTSMGFEVLGPASDYAPGKTLDDFDIVLRRNLVGA